MLLGPTLSFRHPTIRNRCDSILDPEFNYSQPNSDTLNADEERPLNLTVTSNEVSEPIAIENGSIVSSDRIRLNAFFPDDTGNPENDVVNISMITQTGFLFEATDDLVIPADWYDPFFMYMNYSSFNWEYSDIVEENEVVDITLNFSNDDCDVLVWWNDTSQVAKIYPTNLMGAQMVTNNTGSESGSFISERRGILGIGIFNYARQIGYYNLTVDTRERLVVSEIGNSASVDTWTWNRNLTLALDVVGLSLGGSIFIHNYSSLTFNNYFSPSIENLIVTVESQIVIIEWEIADRNQNDTFHSDVGLGTSNTGYGFQFLQDNLSENWYTWDSSGFLSRDNYIIRVVVTDSNGLTDEEFSPPFFAGDPWLEPPGYSISIDTLHGDIEYEEGTIGNEIVWQVTVQSDSAYYQIHVDGIEIQSGNLESGDLVVNVDGYPPNIYRFILTVTNGLDIETDTVSVTVYPRRFLSLANDLLLPGFAVILLASSIIVMEYRRKTKMT